MRWIAGLLLFCGSLTAQLTPEQKELNTASFEKVWTTIRDKHWQKNPGGLDWQAIHDEFRPKVDRAESNDQARALIREMLARLKETHFAVFAANVYEDVGAISMGEGSSGIDVRVLDDRVVVTGVDPGSPAEKAGVKPGWVVISVDAKDLGPAIQKLKTDPGIHEIALERAMLARLTGPIGGSIEVAFLKGLDSGVTVIDLPLAAPRGQLAKFGNLPPMRVWTETKRLGNTGYIRFNMFLDLVHVMSSFSDTVNSCLKQCDGLIIDLRGNPGGIGGMAMGMAGFLLDKPDQKLGTMYLREASLKFVVNPRAEVFTGPVAILVDGTSASTSEIFAGGLKDLGRARIFGTRTAAAALPSVIEKLPNGDGFQYAIANYISEGGQALEGNGVTPDVKIKLTREALLADHDPVQDAALEWIKKQRSPQ
jgi:carboxyl-terminal processing protease